MSDDEVNAFGAALQPGDWFFVEGTNFVDTLVQWGTGDDDKGEVVKASVCHVGNYIGDGVGKTFEADGEKLAYHLFEDYRQRLKNGENRLICFRPKNLTVDELEIFKSGVKSYVGKNYNRWELFWFGVGSAITKFTPFGFVAGLVRNPAYKKDSVVCSQLSALVWQGVDRIYKKLTKDEPIENMTPEKLYDRILRVSDFIFDTAAK
jgi:hypothetical protein